MNPSVGRIVFYYDEHRHERAALVTGVNHLMQLDLAVFYPTHMEFLQAVSRDDDHEAGTWDWTPWQKGQMAKRGEKA